MFAKCIGLSILLLSPSVVAEVYKCSEGVYQEIPCNESSQPIDLSGVGSVVSASTPDPDSLSSQQVASTNGKSKAEKRQDEEVRYARRGEIEQKLSELEKERFNAYLARDKELEKLQSLAPLSSSNGSGIPWQELFSQKITVLNQETDASIAAIDEKIIELKQEM